MGKIMTNAERAVYEWLVKSYDPSDILWNYKGSPDFILSDGRTIEVKRSFFGAIYFTSKEWESLNDKTEIFIVDGEKILSIPFSEVKKFYYQKKPVLCGGKKYAIRVGAKTERLIISCSGETKKAFLRFASNYKSQEEALRELMVKAGVLSEEKIYLF